MFQCPQCGAPLPSDASAALACSCGRSYPRLPGGGIDFLEGREFQDFRLDPHDSAQQQILEQEAAGVSWRMEQFVVPLIRRYSQSSGGAEPSLSALDCGCGNGLSVDILRAHGVMAWGIDAGRARHRQWERRAFPQYLLSADALHLPFAGASFDVVLSSGLIEHIGIHEEEANGYRARRLPDCDAQRRRFIAELVRVLKDDGFILLDHPNGGAPVDFWHGGRGGSLRWHLPAHDMLPRFAEISGYFHAADPTLRLHSLSPARRLNFGQVRTHWYGAAFAPIMRAWLRFLDRPSLSRLSRTFLNPYLVTLAQRQAVMPRWAYPSTPHIKPRYKP